MLLTFAEKGQDQMNHLMLRPARLKLYAPDICRERPGPDDSCKLSKAQKPNDTLLQPRQRARVFLFLLFEIVAHHPQRDFVTGKNLPEEDMVNLVHEQEHINHEVAWFRRANRNTGWRAFQAKISVKEYYDQWKLW